MLAIYLYALTALVVARLVWANSSGTAATRLGTTIRMSLLWGYYVAIDIAPQCATQVKRFAQETIAPPAREFTASLFAL